jgi:hypothetical protein
MRVRRVLVGAVVAVAAVVGVSGMAGSQNGSDDYVLWNVTSGAGNQYFQLIDDTGQLPTQHYTGTAPWTLEELPALMRVSATGGAPHFSGVRHGVKNTGEGQGSQDSISEAEVLTLSIGAHLPRQHFSHITNLKLESQSGAAVARLTALVDGSAVGDPVTVRIPRLQTKTINVDVDDFGEGVSFDAIEFSADSGRFGILPASPATRFHLTAAQVVAPGEPVESQNDDGDKAVTTCLGPTGCAGKGGEVPIEQAFGGDENGKFLDVLFVGEGGTVFLQTVLTYTLDPAPAQLPPSRIDFDPSDEGPFEPVTLCDALAANGPTTGPITPTAKPACLRSLEATGSGNGTVTVVETYELAGDPRVRFG